MFHIRIGTPRQYDGDNNLETFRRDGLFGLATPAELAAIDAVNAFTRARMREDGFARRIMPPLPITNDELNRPGAPAAIEIPFADLSVNLYIEGTPYRVAFDRRVPPRFTLDAVEPGVPAADTLEESSAHT